MRVRADQRVRIKDAILPLNTLGEVLEIDLMTDADARWYDFEAVEGLHAPLQKLITRAVAFELHLHVQAQRSWHAREVDLNGVINH